LVEGKPLKKGVGLYERERGRAVAEIKEKLLRSRIPNRLLAIPEKKAFPWCLWMGRSGKNSEKGEEPIWVKSFDSGERRRSGGQRRSGGGPRDYCPNGG